MLVSVFIFMICLKVNCFGVPLKESIKNTRYFKIISKETVERISHWTEGDQENPWEMSGQYQGDILMHNSVLFSSEQTKKLFWPNNTLIYELDSRFSDSERNLIRETLTEFTRVTHGCITTKEKEIQDKDYVLVTNAPSGCWSHVGFLGGIQRLNLQEGCINFGTILHEFMHTLGFWHEQQRSIRDDYVRIIWKNIKRSDYPNFDKENWDRDKFYDYISNMHYSEWAFSNNGFPTIIPKIPGIKIGSKGRLSIGDIKKLKIMYNCKYKK